MTTEQDMTIKDMMRFYIDKETGHVFSAQHILAISTKDESVRLHESGRYYICEVNGDDVRTTVTPAYTMYINFITYENYVIRNEP